MRGAPRKPWSRSSDPPLQRIIIITLRSQIPSLYLPADLPETSKPTAVQVAMARAASATVRKRRRMSFRDAVTAHLHTASALKMRSICLPTLWTRAIRRLRNALTRLSWRDPASAIVLSPRSSLSRRRWRSTLLPGLQPRSPTQTPRPLLHRLLSIPVASARMEPLVSVQRWQPRRRESVTLLKTTAWLLSKISPNSRLHHLMGTFVQNLLCRQSVRRPTHV